MLLMPGFLFVRLNVDNGMQVRQARPKLVFQFFGELMRLDKGVRVGDLDMDIHMPVRPRLPGPQLMEASDFRVRRENCGQSRFLIRRQGGIGEGQNRLSRQPKADP